jgi:hypothetical protein
MTTKLSPAVGDPPTPPPTADPSVEIERQNPIDESTRPLWTPRSDVFTGRFLAGYLVVIGCLSLAGLLWLGLPDTVNALLGLIVLTTLAVTCLVMTGIPVNMMKLSGLLAKSENSEHKQS